MAINVKVSATAHSVADMVSQNTPLSAAQMHNILTGATAIIAPYPVNSGSSSLMTVTVSEISSDTNGNATLQWSKSTSTSWARAVGQQMTLSPLPRQGAIQQRQHLADPERGVL